MHPRSTLSRFCELFGVLIHVCCFVYALKRKLRASPKVFSTCTPLSSRSFEKTRCILAHHYRDFVNFSVNLFRYVVIFYVKGSRGLDVDRAIALSHFQEVLDAADALDSNSHSWQHFSEENLRSMVCACHYAFSEHDQGLIVFQVLCTLFPVCALSRFREVLDAEGVPDCDFSRMNACAQWDVIVGKVFLRFELCVNSLF